MLFIRFFSLILIRLVYLQKESSLMVEGLKALLRMSDYCLQTVAIRFIVETLLFIPRSKRFAYEAKRNDLRNALKVRLSPTQDRRLNLGVAAEPFFSQFLTPRSSSEFYKACLQKKFVIYNLRNMIVTRKTRAKSSTFSYIFPNVSATAKLIESIFYTALP